MTNFASKPKTKLTAHQFRVLEAIIKGHPETPVAPWMPLDMDELLAELGNTSSKQAMQFTIRALVINGMIEKLDQVRRRGRLRAVYEATILGKAIAAPKAAHNPGIVEPAPGSLEAEAESLLAD